MSSFDLRTRRQNAGLSQLELADRSTITVSQLSFYERGLGTPSDAEFARLALALCEDPDALRRAHTAYMDRVTPGEGYTTFKANSHRVVIPRQRPVPPDKWKVLDLFCGCGGFSFGFEQSGEFAVTAGVDLLTDRVETFRLNHPYATTIVDDIRNIDPVELNALADFPDVVVGGPPCQGFSSIRPFRTWTEGDRRNSLPEQFVFLVGAIRPRWFVFENVVGLLSHERGEPFQSLLRSFQEVGYSVDWRVINMAHLGLPQARERLIIVGNPEGETFAWPTPTHGHKGRSMAGKGAQRLLPEPTFFSAPLRPAVTVSEAIGDLPPVGAGSAVTKYGNGEAGEYARTMRGDCGELTLHNSTRHSDKMMNIIRLSGANRSALPEGLTSSGFSSCYSRLEANKPSTTLTVNFVHPASNRCIHPFQDRALTPREGARLQSFPDDFVFCGSRAQIVKQIGNAVPPLLGRKLAEQIALGFMKRGEAAA